MNHVDKSEDVDAQVQRILEALGEYERIHSNAEIEVRRQNPVSIRIRIIDPDFEGMNRVDREPEVWRLLRTLPEDVLPDITMVLLLTPKEVEGSLASREFDAPVPSRL